TLLFLVLSLIYFLLFKLFVCFSTASSRNAKEAASVNLQPLQSNLKVLQEQQTQPQHSMFWGAGLTLSRCRRGLSQALSIQLLPRCQMWAQFFATGSLAAPRGGANLFSSQARASSGW